MQVNIICVLMSVHARECVFCQCVRIVGNDLKFSMGIKHPFFSESEYITKKRKAFVRSMQLNVVNIYFCFACAEIFAD